MGCEIGTHTYSHVNLNSLSVPEMQEEIKKSCDAISKYTGKNVKVLRPPEGAANDTVKANVGMPMVLWSVDSRDWDYRNADNKESRPAVIFFQGIENFIRDRSIRTVIEGKAHKLIRCFRKLPFTLFLCLGCFLGCYLRRFPGCF